MPFTDDELKKLKELISWRDTADTCYTLPAEQIDALIARLECAENFGLYPTRDTYLAWSKASGK